MELVGNLKIAHLALLVIWLSTLLVSMVSQAYPLSPSTGGEEDMYNSDRHVLEEIKWIRSLLSAPHETIQTLKRDSQIPPGYKVQKRINFGVAGLDIMDFILTNKEEEERRRILASNEQDAKTQKKINLMRAKG